MCPAPRARGACRRWKDAVRRISAPALSPEYPFRPPEGREKLRHDPASRAAARPASLRRLLLTPAADPALPCKPFVVAHDQLRLKLLNGIHRDSGHDQHRGTAEIKVVRQAFQN